MNYLRVFVGLVQAMPSVDSIVCEVAESTRLSDFRFCFQAVQCWCSVASVAVGSAAPWTKARQAPLSSGFPRRGYGVGCHLLLQGNS